MNNFFVVIRLFHGRQMKINFCYLKFLQNSIFCFHYLNWFSKHIDGKISARFGRWKTSSKQPKDGKKYWKSNEKKTFYKRQYGNKSKSFYTFFSFKNTLNLIFSIQIQSCSIFSFQNSDENKIFKQKLEITKKVKKFQNFSFPWRFL